MRVLFVSSPPGHFASLDADLLKPQVDAVVFEWRGRTSVLPLRRALKEAALGIGWFAEDHSAVLAFLCRLQRKPSIVVAGGSEVSSDPTGTFGSGGTWKGRFLRRYALSKASVVIAPSKFTSSEVRRLVQPRSLQVIPNAVDTGLFRPLAKQPIVATAALRITERTWRTKGIDVFCDAARHMPDVPFMVIGEMAVNRSLLQEVPPNVRFRGTLRREELARALGTAAVYCQLSRYESFGMALAEAMAAGCIPVTTQVGALPETRGPWGLGLPDVRTEKVVTAIRSALDAPTGEGERVRSWTSENFSEDRRRQALSELVRSLLAER